MGVFSRRAGTGVILCALGALKVSGAQSSVDGSSTLGSVAETTKGGLERPLPDVAGLMHLVEQHQKDAEATIQNYLYTSTIQGLKLDGRGDTKRETDREMEIFYIDGVRLQRTVRKGGRALNADKQEKENERIDKAIAKARQERARGESNAHKDEVSFSRFLELGAFSNERRVMLGARSTIALDYAGDPKAKTHNQIEGAIHDMAGTVWVDEEDAALSRVEGHFVNTFKVGGGLVAYVAKDTSFVANSTRVNGEVWLPSTFTAQGSMHVLLFFSFNGRVSGTNTNYRRFKAGSTILPDVQEVDSMEPKTAKPESSLPGVPGPQ